MGNGNDQDSARAAAIRRLDQAAFELGKVVRAKNEAYGDSYAKSEAFLRILYPDGVKPVQYGDMLTLVRMFDKMMRVATDRDAMEEDPYLDIGGYAILGRALVLNGNIETAVIAEDDEMIVEDLRKQASIEREKGDEGE